MKEIYLDNSATTKVDDDVAKKVFELMTEKYGNPSSLHSKGLEAEREVVCAKKLVAQSLGVQADEIYFTSGGTEANNLAVFGAVKAKQKLGKRIVTTAIEHSSVYEAMQELENQGFEVVYLKPDKFGNITAEQIQNAVTSDTILVSIMLVNNELGSVLPVSSIYSAVKKCGSKAVIHTDCVQAFGKIPVKAGKLKADLITITGHKIHAPKGIGALYVAKGTRIIPRQFGGEQQKKLRPGTESSPLIAGFGLAVQNLNINNEDIKSIHDYALEKLRSIPEIVINSGENAIPYIINFSVLGINSETMLHFLASKGIFVSGGSACAKGKKSYVLTACDISRERIESAIRVSFSKYNTTEDVDALISGLTEGIGCLQKKY